MMTDLGTQRCYYQLSWAPDENYGDNANAVYNDNVQLKKILTQHKMMKNRLSTTDQLSLAPQGRLSMSSLTLAPGIFHSITIFGTIAQFIIIYGKIYYNLKYNLFSNLWVPSATCPIWELACSKFFLVFVVKITIRGNVYFYIITIIMMGKC